MAKFKTMKGDRHDLKHWCKKYDLTYREFNCSKCNNIIKTDIMFVESDKFFGIQTSPCESCGNHDLKGEFHSEDEEFNKGWKSIAEHGL